MKQHLKKIALAILGISITSLLFSFSSSKGGDRFEILLNGKEILQQHVYNMKGVPELSVPYNSIDDQLEVSYSHCGKTGTGRFITVANRYNKPLRVWQYDDATNNRTQMILKLKDIFSLQKDGESLFLTYSSKELPKGKLLASINKSHGGITRK